MTAQAAAALRLATRGSALARAQAAIAASALQAATGRASELVVVRTSGDRQASVPFDQLTGQGWFTAELERAVAGGGADIAVHSAKDLPIACAPGLVVAAYLARADPRDCVVSRDGRPLAELAPGARVGTGSVRRAALLRAQHPRLEPVPVRGNVDTRLRKLDAGEFDALILASAGLDRLGLAARISERLDPAVWVPSPAQGAIALECRQRSAAVALCAAAGDRDTAAAVTAERAVLQALGGSCLLPLGAWARLEGGGLRLTAALGGEARSRFADSRGSVDDPAALGAAVGEALS